MKKKSPAIRCHFQRFDIQVNSGSKCSEGTFCRENLRNELNVCVQVSVGHGLLYEGGDVALRSVELYKGSVYTWSQLENIQCS